MEAERNEEMERIQKRIHAFRILLTEEKRKEILKKAEEGLHGMLVLNGMGPVPHYVGEPPRWDQNPAGVGGYTWTMSRLMYMTKLCQAYFITEDEIWIRKVAGDLSDWLDKEPPPPVPVDHDSAMVYHGVHHWRMLEVGFRTVYTFPIILDALRKYGKAQELVQRLLICIHQHGERIRTGSHYLWPNKDHNHYLMEMVGLLGAAALNPEDPEADDWADHAIKEIEECGFRQISEDGGQIEGCPSYHNDCMEHFCMAVYAAGKLKKSFSEKFLKRLRKGIDFSVYTLRPDGRGVTIGDSDPDRVAVECAVYGWLLFEDTRWMDAIRKLVPFEAIWDAAVSAWGFPRMEKLLTLEDREPGAEFPLENIQHQIQQYYARTGWDHDALSLTFICRSPVHYGCHGHIDPLSFDFTAYGKPMVTDPGRFTYKDGEDRHLYKSSAVHSMPTLEGKDAFEYIATFAYGEQKQGGITSVCSTRRVKAAAGFHDNYEPARLERIIGILDGRFLLILDTFRNAKGRRAEIFFHLNSRDVAVEKRAVRTREEKQNLLLCSTISDVRLLEGRLSDVFYHDYPSRRAVFTEEIREEEYEAATIIVPFRGKAEAVVKELRLLSDEKEIRFSLEGHEYVVGYESGMFEIKEG